MSSERPTLFDCLRELGRLIQRDHGPTCVDVVQELQADEKDVVDVSTKRPVDEGAVSCNANDMLILRTKLKSLEERVLTVNKSVLDAEKERDKIHKELEFIEVQLCKTVGT